MSTETPGAVDEAAEHLGDALFTYCLSVLCDQDEALTAVREVKQLAIRHGRRLRRPELQRAWLYALARYVCLVRLERGGLAPWTPPIRPRIRGSPGWRGPRRRGPRPSSVSCWS
ncbi:hypothetical protein ACFQZC_21505 [Streptacidiphilus monticola]